MKSKKRKNLGKEKKKSAAGLTRPYSENKTPIISTDSELDGIKKLSETVTPTPELDDIKKQVTGDADKKIDIDISDLNETVKSMVCLPFDYIAKRRGAHWKLNKDEANRLSLLTTKVLGKYLSVALLKYSDELALSVTVLIIFSERLQYDKLHTRQEGEREKSSTEKKDKSNKKE